MEHIKTVITNESHKYILPIEEFWECIKDKYIQSFDINYSEFMCKSDGGVKFTMNIEDVLAAMKYNYGMEGDIKRIETEDTDNGRIIKISTGDTNINEKRGTLPRGFQ